MLNSINLSRDIWAVDSHNRYTQQYYVVCCVQLIISATFTIHEYLKGIVLVLVCMWFCYYSNYDIFGACMNHVEVKSNVYSKSTELNKQK